MTLVNNRNIYRFFLIVSFILVNVFVLLGINKTLDFLNKGADRSTMLHLEKETITTYSPEITWKNENHEGRAMEPTTLKNIEKDYLFSWLVKNRALQNNSKMGIEDYYTQNTRKNLYRTIDYNLKNGISIENTTLEHHPKLEFYSADGQQVVFTDKNVVEFQKIYQQGTFLSSIQDTATYKVMMLLEDGFWRVRHFQKMMPVPIASDSIQKNIVFTVKNNHILKNNIPYTIKGINYYPKNSAWDTFGKFFNADTISKDFEIIKNAKLNTIRIFVQYEDFGKAEIRGDKLEKLKKIISLAKAKKLNVIVTLFDFYNDYTLENWTLTHRHAEKLVSALKNYDNIIAWDIKNEPDLDFKNRYKVNVINWLDHMITVIKKYDPNHLVTIGWSNSQEAKNLASKVDFVSYHFYNSIADFEKENKILEKKVHKAILIEEFGIPSYNGIWNLRGTNEADQAEYHKKMQALFKKNKLAFLSWTLYDFPHVPNQVAGRWPWQKRRQMKFGFINEKGAKKPSFLHISN